MGIQGEFYMLPYHMLIDPDLMKSCNLKKFAGQTVGVDAYGWLHRGTVPCAIELALDRPTNKFVDFAMHRVRMLQHFGIIPFLVFDGDYLPSKAATEVERAKRREHHKNLGLELLNAGKSSQAHLELQKAVDVTPEMARQLIEELKKIGVQYIVAPYEADAQMVYLERKGVISAILSEDSDLLVFGAKRLLTKLDQYGNCIEINRAEFCACREINLTGWSDTEFRRMAILSGCDYLANISNMGLKTAYRMIRKYKTIEKVLQMLQFDGKYPVPKGYLEAFYRAELTFLYQRVYCPLSETLVFHTQPDKPIVEGEMPFIGAYVDPGIARRVATGELNPITKEPIFSKEASPTPRAPWKASKPRPRCAVTADDLKKGVSIEEYFKPKRIPLGEMDPNCFTPSPNENSHLPRNAILWPEDLPRPYIYRPNTGLEPRVLQSAPDRPLVSTTRRVSWEASISEPRPSKRARLCADYRPNDTLAYGNTTFLEQSRFFGSPSPDPSPSVGRSVKTKRPKKEDSIVIFSDDSIEEALLSLPDCDGWQKVRPTNAKIEIFNENIDEQDKKSISLTKSAAQVGPCDSQTSLPNQTVASSIDILSTPIEPTHLPLSFLKEKFAFIPPATSPKASALPTPPSSVKPSRIPLAVKSLPSERQNTCILTPLQRLGVKALSGSNPQTLPYTPTIRSAMAKRRLMSPTSKPIDSNPVPFPEVASQSGVELALSSNPADVALPQPDHEKTVKTVALMLDVTTVSVSETTGKGSEDLIVHDSEEEYNEASSPIDESSKVPKLGLGRFTFRK